MSEMGAARFKAHCLRVMETVRRTRQEIVITKRGVPVAKLVPVPATTRKDVFGYMSDRTESDGDIEAPTYSELEWQEIERERREQWDTWNSRPPGAEPRKLRPQRVPRRKRR